MKIILPLLFAAFLFFDTAAAQTVTPTPEDFAAMVRSELDYFGKLIKQAGIKLTE